MAGFMVRPSVGFEMATADIVHVSAHGDVNPDGIVDAHVIRLGRYVRSRGLRGALTAPRLWSSSPTHSAPFSLFTVIRTSP
jgi:hypothetical protein